MIPPNCINFLALFLLPNQVFFLPRKLLIEFSLIEAKQNQFRSLFSSILYVSALSVFEKWKNERHKIKFTLILILNGNVYKFSLHFRSFNAYKLFYGRKEI